MRRGVHGLKFNDAPYWLLLVFGREWSDLCSEQIVAAAPQQPASACLSCAGQQCVRQLHELGWVHSDVRRPNFVLARARG